MGRGQTPDGTQHLLGQAKCDADQVRYDVRTYVAEHVHDSEAVLVVDETGDVKKGTDTVGAQRQSIGTPDRIEKVQVAVYPVSPTAAGRRRGGLGTVRSAFLGRRPRPLPRRRTQ
ncbi:transposase [Streptomyces sp. NPDC001815]|uniref:transposase n=1 Tax=Streptomyces sp. NPDC001815 TaxID=3154526 RepID=UPI00331E8C70